MAGNLHKLRRLETGNGADPSWLEIAKAVGVPVATWGLNQLFGSGGGGGQKAQNEALSAQMDIAKMLADLQKKQAKIDLPFRSDLFSALRDREKQQFDRIMPQEPSYSNPMQKLKKATSLPGQGPDGGTPAYKGGFNARPGLNEALREQRKPRTPMDQLQGLMDRMGGGGGGGPAGKPGGPGGGSLPGGPGGGGPMPGGPGRGGAGMPMPGGRGGAGMPMPGGPGGGGGGPSMPPPEVMKALAAKGGARHGAGGGGQGGAGMPMPGGGGFGGAGMPMPGGGDRGGAGMPMPEEGAPGIPLPEYLRKANERWPQLGRGGGGRGGASGGSSMPGGGSGMPMPGGGGRSPDRANLMKALLEKSQGGGGGGSGSNLFPRDIQFMPPGFNPTPVPNPNLPTDLRFDPRPVPNPGMPNPGMPNPGMPTDIGTTIFNPQPMPDPGMPEDMNLLLRNIQFAPGL